MASEEVTTYTPSKARIEAFSDGVIAIVVTLLVFNLKLPEGASLSSASSTLDALIKIAPTFGSFAVSFFVVAIFWVNHHQFFHNLKRSDRALLWHNNHFLFWLTFIPFPTQFLGENPTNAVAAALYGLALFLAAGAITMGYRHALKADLFFEEIPRDFLQEEGRRAIIGPFVYLAASLAAFISLYISLALYVLVPLLYFLPRKHKRVI